MLSLQSMLPSSSQLMLPGISKVIATLHLPPREKAARGRRGHAELAAKVRAGLMGHEAEQLKWKYCLVMQKVGRTNVTQSEKELAS
jgi:hypothetical protein